MVAICELSLVRGLTTATLEEHVTAGQGRLITVTPLDRGVVQEGAFGPTCTRHGARRDLHSDVPAGPTILHPRRGPPEVGLPVVGNPFGMEMPWKAPRSVGLTAGGVLRTYALRPRIRGEGDPVDGVLPGVGKRPTTWAAGCPQA